MQNVYLISTARNTQYVKLQFRITAKGSHVLSCASIPPLWPLPQCCKTCRQCSLGVQQDLLAILLVLFEQDFRVIACGNHDFTHYKGRKAQSFRQLALASC